MDQQVIESFLADKSFPMMLLYSHFLQGLASCGKSRRMNVPALMIRRTFPEFNVISWEERKGRANKKKKMPIRVAFMHR
jgi:hypothetical protein